MGNSTTVLLGAGASFDAHVPLASGLTEKAVESLTSVQMPRWSLGIRGWNRTYPSEDLALAMAFVITTMQASDIENRVTGAARLNSPGIESIVSAVQMLAERDRLEISPFVHEWARTIEVLDVIGMEPGTTGVVEAIAKATKDTRMPLNSWRDAVKRFDAALARAANPSRRDIFEGLYLFLRANVSEVVSTFAEEDVDYLQNLARACATSDCTVATLNYDSTFEVAARRAGLCVDLAVEHWTKTGKLTTRDDAAVRLLKLHGSADWHDLGDGSFEIADDWQRVPLLIYGARGKLTARGPFLQLLEEFRTALIASDRLVAIGYSFGDGHINELVWRWMKTSPSSVLTVVDPSPMVSLPNRIGVSSSPLFLNQVIMEYGPSIRRRVLNAEHDNYINEEIPSRVRFVRAGAGAALSGLESLEDLRSLDGTPDDEEAVQNGRY